MDEASVEAELSAIWVNVREHAGQIRHMSPKGGNMPETITLDTPQPVHFQDEVTFTTQTDKPNSSIQLQCFQDGVLVFAAAHSANPGGYGYGDPFQLGPSSVWTGGAADAVAVLGHRTKGGKFISDDEVEFPVEA